MLLVDVDAGFCATSSEGYERAAVEVHVAVGVNAVVAGAYGYYGAAVDSEVARGVDGIIVG